MKKTAALFSVFLLLPFLLAAQQMLPDIKEVRVHKTGDAVEVSFEIVPQRMRPDYRVTFVPVLYGGSERIELEPLVLSRRRRAISDSRLRVNAGMRAIVGKRPLSPVLYRTTVPYRAWMQCVALHVTCVVSRCCMSLTYPEVSLSDSMLLDYTVIPHYDRRERRIVASVPERYASDHPLLHPAAEYADRFAILERDRHLDSNFIRFRLSSSHIDASRPGNGDVLERTVRAIDMICDDPHARLEKIFIAGYASPEGGHALNDALARKRALSIRDYLIRHAGHPLDAACFELYNGGEDWDGLRRLVDASDLDEKERILLVIDSAATDEWRKTDLKHLDMYGRLLEKFYPALRNAGYIQIYYDIEPEGPSSAGRSKAVHSTGIQGMEKDDAKAYNEALALMERGAWVEARENLRLLGDDPEALNALGVCYMMTGDYDQADGLFLRAVAAGNSDAQLNLDQTQTARRVR